MYHSTHSISGRLFGLMLSVLVLASCNSNNTGGDFNNAGGKPYEVIVAVDQELWNGETGDTLRSIMLEPIPMFNQVEPHFDLVRVTPGALKDVVLRHRNILIVETSAADSVPTSLAKYNLYARPQIIVTISAPTARELTRYLTENRRELQQLFEITERNRAVDNNAKYGERGINDIINKTFGIEMNIPRGFSIKGRSGNDFLWVGNDVKVATQGLVIYTYPYSGPEDFEPDNLIARRNEFMGLIPGPSDNSFMATETYIMPEVTYPSINDRRWAEMHGFWYVENDFMGGPFVNYTTIDPSTKQVISIDCFVHSPKDPKRNLLRQLQHTVYSVKFAQAQQPEQTR